MKKILVSSILLATLLACGESKIEPKQKVLDPSGSNKEIVSNRRYKKSEIEKILREFPSPYKLALQFAKEIDVGSDIDYVEIDSSQTKLEQEPHLITGLYNADMAFAAASGNGTKFVEFAERILLIAKQKNAPVLVNEALLENLKDSVEGNTSHLYEKMFVDNSLELSSHIDQKTAIMIISSSWLECMYLGSKSITDKKIGYKKIIAAQKENLYYLIQLLNSLEEKDQPELLDRLEVLSAIYEKVEISQLAKNDYLENEVKRRDSISSRQKSIKMSEPVLHAIEKEIEGIRRSILNQGES